MRVCGPLAGKRLLVNGATGGVGHFAVQIARARGAEVTAVCSARHADTARALGATTVVDYRDASGLAACGLRSEMSGASAGGARRDASGEAAGGARPAADPSRGQRFDLVYDAYGHLGFGAARPALTPTGRYVTPLGLPAVFARALVQNIIGRQRLLVANVRDRPGDYAELESLVISGAVRPLIDRVLPLEQAREAFAAVEAGGFAGKIVIRLDAPPA